MFLHLLDYVYFLFFNVNCFWTFKRSGKPLYKFVFTALFQQKVELCQISMIRSSKGSWLRSCCCYSSVYYFSQRGRKRVREILFLHFFQKQMMTLFSYFPHRNNEVIWNSFAWTQEGPLSYPLKEDLSKAYFPFSFFCFLFQTIVMYVDSCDKERIL